MPRSLLNRCQRDDCVAEFRAAAQQRFLDGIAAAVAGRRTAAIYLWGYAAEMTLKAAYFRAIGFAESQVITAQDRQAAITAGKNLGIAWPGAGGHNIRAWAELLETWRTATPGAAYNPLTIGHQVLTKGQRIAALWVETLRYRKNIAYNYEVRQVRESAEWLLANSILL